MKFIIAVVLLAAVVGVYSEPQQASASPKAKAGSKNISDADIATIQAILTKIVGPKIATFATNLIKSLVNGSLAGLPISGLTRAAVNVLNNLLKSKGTVESLLAGGDPNAFNANAKGANGKPKNLSPADQARIFKILRRTVGAFTANYIVRITAIAINGIIGRIPLQKLLHSVTGIVENVANPKGLVGKVIGQQGVGKPVSRLLGDNKA